MKTQVRIAPANRNNLVGCIISFSLLSVLKQNYNRLIKFANLFQLRCEQALFHHWDTLSLAYASNSWVLLRAGSTGSCSSRRDFKAFKVFKLHSQIILKVLAD